MSAVTKKSRINFGLKQQPIDSWSIVEKNMQIKLHNSNNLKKFKTKFKNKTQEWLVTKKNVEMLEDQELVDNFNCGYSGNIVVTGKLYITSQRVCFYSAFNDHNIFFDSTFIQIPKQEILKIQKKHNAKIFDNSIEITKSNLQSVFFTSFVSRNRCYDIMVHNLKLPSQSQSNINLSNNPQKSHIKSDYDYDSQFLTQKIVFEEFEYFIHSFSCGLATVINIMGRMYVTNKRIFFYSIFDQKGTQNSHTQVDIPADSILKIQKRYNTLIFDNSILIVIQKGSYFFTSFFARDKTFQILLDVFVYGKQVPQISQEENLKLNYQLQVQGKLIQNYSPQIVRQSQFGLGIEKLNQSIKVDFIERQNQIFQNLQLQKKTQSKIYTYQDEIDTQKVSQQEFTRNVPQNDDITEEQVICREKQILKTIGRENELQVIGQTVLKFPGLNAIKALRLFDSGQQIFINGKVYESFMKFFKEEIIKRKNVRISRWSPNILEYLNTSNLKANSPLQFSRDIEQIVKIERTGIPFMPKQANSRERQRLFLISKDKYIVKSYVQNSGAPYSDSFYNNGRRIVETISQNSIRVTVSMQTVFKKRPFIGSLIEEKCEEEGTKQQKIMFETMRDYLKNLEQNKVKK